MRTRTVLAGLTRAADLGDDLYRISTPDHSGIAPDVVESAAATSCTCAAPARTARPRWRSCSTSGCAGMRFSGGANETGRAEPS
ncbi:hypothetical protein [Catellatospora paridis]|uniref:hypothetical protein n=1 Tax=Catellatospora paridis TaxID=1617086 RepID=UPI0012D3EBA5|nr:hypothetical protein [Catellatospora paridis]